MFPNVNFILFFEVCKYASSKALTKWMFQPFLGVVFF